MAMSDNSQTIETITATSKSNTMSRDEVRQRLIREKLVVIIRVTDPNDISPIIACMHKAGVGAVEITSNLSLIHI